MSGLAGIRVMRGPDWTHGNSDGGEGHLGTLTQLLSNGQVCVLWDKGQETTCSAGAGGKFELRVFDTAQAGIRHPSTKCVECGECNIYGTLWRCQDCSHCDLCTVCYGDDKHDLRHPFLRIDHHLSHGESVKKRKVSVRMRSMGTFPGAKVTRGKDWAWGNQDGGPGSEGVVESYENVAPDSSRNLVRVHWNRSDKSNSYRLGFRGSIDLCCLEEEVGPFYYRDHLPSLDASKLPYPLAPPEAFTANPSTTTTASASTASDTSASTSELATSKSSSANNSSSSPPSPPNGISSQASALSDGGTEGGDSCEKDDANEVTCGEPEAEEEELPEVLAVGDEAMVGVNENTLRDLQEDFGGVSSKMLKMLKEKGKVEEVNMGVVVRFGSSAYRFNPLALVKVSPLKEGDVIRIRRDVSQVKELNKHVGWSQQIAETCGSVGRVQSVRKQDDTVMVSLGHYQTFRFSTACCIPAPGATPNPLGAMVQARQAAVAGAETHTEGAVGGAPSEGNPAKPAVGQQKAGTSASGWSGATASVMGGERMGDGAQGGAGPSVMTLGHKKERDNRSSPVSSDTDIQRTLLRMMNLVDDDDSHTDPQLRLLFALISRGNTSDVTTVVKANRSLLRKTEQTLTPLMYACHKGQEKVVRALLELGDDVNGVGGQGRTPLHIAINAGHQDIAMMLLSQGAYPNTMNHRQRTPLHAAAYDNLTNVAQMLISLGADVNAKDHVQDTPLFDAIDKGHDAMVVILLQSENLNPYELNAKGFNMLQLACLRGKARIVELILSSPRNPGVDELLLGEYSALHIAANNDHVECVGMLVLIGGATIDIPDGRRQLTPLHLACKRRMFKAAEALVELGAQVNALDINGNTPLHLAVGKRLQGDHDDNGVSVGTAVEERSKVAIMLLSNGAVLDLPDDQGNPPKAYGFKEVHVMIDEHLRKLHRVGIPTSHGTAAPPLITSAVDVFGGQKTKHIGVDHGVFSKQQDTQCPNNLLHIVSIQCALCDAMSDVTLVPCGHKTVCRKCCDGISQCPQCGVKVEDSEPDNTDDQEEQELEAEEEGERKREKDKQHEEEEREATAEGGKEEVEEEDDRFNEKMENDEMEKEENEEEARVDEK